MMTTFRKQFDIPMNQITYDLIENNRRDIVNALRNGDMEVLDKIPKWQIAYDEDLQMATFTSNNPFLLEQTSNYFIITMYVIGPVLSRYFIDKKTGTFTKRDSDSIFPSQLLDGLLRVYGLSERELSERDFISDGLKRYLKELLWERAFDDAWRDDEDDEF